MNKIKVEILKIVELKNYSIGKKYIVEINLLNMYERNRKIEIGIVAFDSLKLKVGKSILVYENPNKKGDFKILYSGTFKLYGLEYKKYYNKK